MLLEFFVSVRNRMKNKDFVRIWWAGGIENRRHRRIQTACQIGEPVNGKVSSQTLKIHLVQDGNQKWEDGNWKRCRVLGRKGSPHVGRSGARADFEPISCFGCLLQKGKLNESFPGNLYQPKLMIQGGNVKTLCPAVVGRVCSAAGTDSSFILNCAFIAGCL